jgi:hypothetical protein
VFYIYLALAQVRTARTFDVYMPSSHPAMRGLNYYWLLAESGLPSAAAIFSGNYRLYVYSSLRMH